MSAKLTPPKEVQHQLLEHGCYIPRTNVPHSGDDPLRDEFVRYKKWCRKIVRQWQRNDEVQRKHLREGKRAFAYGRDDLSHKKHTIVQVQPVMADDI